MHTKLYKSVTNIAVIGMLASTMLLGSLLMSSAVAHAQSEDVINEELQLRINELLVLVASLKAQLAAVASSNDDSKCAVFTRTMFVGSRDATTNGEVSRLQKYLMNTGDYTYGEVTGYYGLATQGAVQKWQARNGVVTSGTPGTTGYGMVGSRTRSAIAKRCATVQPQILKKGTIVAVSQLPLSVVDGHSIDVVSPVRGSVFGPGKTTEVRWNTVNMKSVSIALYEDSKWVYWITKDRILPQETGTFVYNWQIPSDIGSIIDSGKNLQIYMTGRVSGDNGYRDTKSAQFSIEESETIGQLVPVSPIEISNTDITVTSPNGGEVWRPGMVNTITWKPYDYDPDINPSNDVTAYLDKKENGIFKEVGRILENGKASIHTHLEIDRPGNYAEPGEYYVRVVNDVTGASDRSDRPFTIKKHLSDEDIIVTAPNGGEVWRPGMVNTITWKPYDYDPDINPSNDVTAYLDKKENGIFKEVGRILENGKASIHTHLEIDRPGNYAEPGEYYVRVVNDRTGATDRSDRPFTIEPRIEDIGITVTAPNGGEVWEIGKTNTITWKPYDYDPDINPSNDVKAYLDKKVDGTFREVGRILRNGKASIHTSFEIDRSSHYADPGVYYVRVVNNVTGASDRSDRSFTLTSRDITPEQPPLEGSLKLRVDAPNGFQTLAEDTIYPIKWSSTPDIDQVSIGWSTGIGSLNWIKGASNISNTGWFNWNVDVGTLPAGSSKNVKIHVIGYDIGVGSVSDQSDNFFTVIK